VLDPVRIAAYGITVQAVNNALAQQNIATPGGEVEQRDAAIPVLADTALNQLDEFRNLELRHGKDGFVIRLSDVGKAVVDADQSLTQFRYGGKNAIAVGLVPQTTGNPLEISKAVRAMLPALRQAAPKTMTIEMAFDTSLPIQASVDEVVKTIVIAIALVLAVVLFFLGSLSTSMIPLVTVPLSLVGTMFFMVCFMPSRACTLTAVAGKVWSGVAVASTIRSRSLPLIPACARARRAAATARSEVSSPGAAMRRSPMPVRWRIQASEVSRRRASSSFVTIRSGR
jgi:multidrug efflux pump